MKSCRTTLALLLVLSLTLTATSLTACDTTSTMPDYDYRIDMKDYEEAVTANRKTYLKLANKQNPLGESYAPVALATLPAALTLNGKTVELETITAIAAEALVRELHARGYRDIRITSGYRTYAYQQSLFHTYLEQEQKKHPDWTEAQCIAEVATYSARPGESEHQTGLCMDLISTEHVALDETFAQNPAYAYLIENAHYFGFILRYPAGAETITGYSYEPWHFRFVGIEAATAIHDRAITLEEYLA